MSIIQTKSLFWLSNRILMDNILEVKYMLFAEKSVTPRWAFRRQ